LDNARYHHAKLVQDWLSRPDCRIRLHFVPAYCPHLNPIERLWGVMHKHVTHNKCYAARGRVRPNSCRRFRCAVVPSRSTIE
ncbi:MAG TPA: transposase, partial [Casimicrobiaceae bacterium]|nr:transposase [Casimicrobiaceae bacterium]